MAEPIRIPTRLGEPCWTDANLEATVRTIAAMGEESTSRFLATHAPMSHIRVGDTERTISDAGVFEAITRLSARENVVVVHGAPGTGKSHLINWVKLRYDHGISTGRLANVLPVLVRRRTGSLKDALEQLVEQLPDRFHRYLEPVQSAIARISEKEARKKLATELHLELGVRREEAGKPRLPRTLRHLSEVFHSEGFGAWLCREGGVIDRNIQRLISPSELVDREGFPEFTGEEFLVSDLRQRSAGRNTQNVCNLIDEFLEDSAAADEAARLCNDCLRAALQALTGLGNAALSTILRAIRQDLRKEGKRLVLLIEDVSTLSVLDDEVVNAVEPQDDARLCDLTSVLGMTEQAYRRLRDNQYQRVAGSGLIFSFPKDASAKSWAGDDRDTDRFIARYLNATRLPDSQIALIAEHRRPGDDVNISACDDCPVRVACHDTFGAIVFDETAVGLFPFRGGTAPQLLGRLDNDQVGVQQTQRGLLDHITKPVMRHIEGLADGDRNALGLPITPRSLTDWQPLVETYLGDWNPIDRARMRLLAEAWTTRLKAPEVASDLQALLAPFSLPGFSARAEPAPPILPIAGPGGELSTREGKTPAPVLTTPTPADAAAQKLLAGLLNRVERWSAGARFEISRDHQEMVLAFLKGALPTEDIRSPAAPARRLLRDADRGSIRIEDSATQSANPSAAFDLPRNQDTHDLLVALTHQKVLGGGKWTFPEAERYKRMVARWLRRHQDEMLAALDPVGLSTRDPVKLATKFLCMAATVERRAALPADTSLALSYVTTDSDRAQPTALTRKMKDLFADLPDRRRSIQKFLFEETTVPQGTGGINVIDPQVIMEAITEARSNLTLVALPADYQARYWKTRYQALDGLKYWATLPAAVSEERDAIRALVSEVDQTLARNGFAVGGEYSGLTAFLADVERLFDLLKKEFSWPAADIGFFKTEKIALSATQLAKDLAQAASVAEGVDDVDVLLFDPKDLLKIQDIVARCTNVVEQAKAHAAAKFEKLRDDQDPDELERQIIHELARVGGVVQEVSA